jgi:hypothetical protein
VRAADALEVSDDAGGAAILSPRDIFGLRPDSPQTDSFAALEMAIRLEACHARFSRLVTVSEA